MEPTETPMYRRAELIERIIVCLTGAGMALYMLDGHMAAIFFALSFIVLLCHICDVNPFKLIWRMLRAAVGHKFDNRFTWGEVSFHRYWQLGLCYSMPETSDDHHTLIVHAIWVSLYLRLPFKNVSQKHLRDMKGADYGFYTMDRNQIVFRWGIYADAKDVKEKGVSKGYWSWDFPFVSFKHFSTEVLSTDGKRTVWKELASDRGDWSQQHREKEAAQAENCEVHPYQYTRRNGEIQYRMATCYIERWIHTRKWFPFLKRVKTSIWVTFNEEIGEEVGTWKGGTTGCGWELRRGETIEQSLRRMESERLFERGRREKKSTKRGFLARLFLP